MLLILSHKPLNTIPSGHPSPSGTLPQPAPATPREVPPKPPPKNYASKESALFEALVKDFQSLTVSEARRRYGLQASSILEAIDRVEEDTQTHLENSIDLDNMMVIEVLRRSDESLRRRIRESIERKEVEEKATRAARRPSPRTSRRSHAAPPSHGYEDEGGDENDGDDEGDEAQRTHASREKRPYHPPLKQHALAQHDTHHHREDTAHTPSPGPRKNLEPLRRSNRIMGSLSLVQEQILQQVHDQKNQLPSPKTPPSAWRSWSPVFWHSKNASQTDLRRPSIERARLESASPRRLRKKSKDVATSTPTATCSVPSTSHTDLEHSGPERGRPRLRRARDTRAPSSPGHAILPPAAVNENRRGSRDTDSPSPRRNAHAPFPDAEGLGGSAGTPLLPGPPWNTLPAAPSPLSTCQRPVASPETQSPEERSGNYVVSHHEAVVGSAARGLVVQSGISQDAAREDGRGGEWSRGNDPGGMVGKRAVDEAERMGNLGGRDKRQGQGVKTMVFQGIRGGRKVYEGDSECE